MNETERMKRFPHLPQVRNLFLVVVLTQAFLACDPSPQSKTASALQNFYDKHDRGWTVRLSEDQKRVTRLVGRSSQSYTGATVEKALQFLRENQLLFGLEHDLKDLKVLEARDTPVGANVEFQQTFNALPVENGRIKINFDKDGHVLQFVSSYAPTAGSVDQAVLSKDAATEKAINEFLRTTPVPASKLNKQKESDTVLLSRSELKVVQDPKVEDVFFVRQERLHRAFKTLISAVKPFGIREIITDAQDGSVLQTRDFVYDATDCDSGTPVDGQGRVFIPNPVNSLNNPALHDDNDDNAAVTPDYANPYSTVPLMTLDPPTNGLYQLRGPYVVLEDIEAPCNTPPSEPDPNGFMYLRNADSFEDVMVYYHIDRLQQYIQSLRFMNIMNKQLAVDAHGNDGVDNSHYVGLPNSIYRPYIAFGDYGVDDAEDGDTIAHEYGHAIQDDQAPGNYGVSSGFNRYPKAMAEGFGDYWAVSSFRDVNNISLHPLPCVMEWDKVLNDCGRRVDNSVTAYNFDPAGTDHENGKIWSATLYEIFTKLDNKADADKLILQSHFNVPDGPTFIDGADSIMTADRQLFAGSHIAQLCQVFIRRKIYGYSDCSSLPAATGNVNTY